jgi:hypothetical protein
MRSGVFESSYGPGYLPRCLDEFCFRYDHRCRAHEIRALVLGRALHSDPMPLFRLRTELTALTATRPGAALGSSMTRL